MLQEITCIEGVGKRARVTTQASSMGNMKREGLVERHSNDKAKKV